MRRKLKEAMCAIMPRVADNNLRDDGIARHYLEGRFRGTIWKVVFQALSGRSFAFIYLCRDLRAQ